MPYTFLSLALFNSSLPVYKWSQSGWPEDWVLFETPVRISNVDGDRKEERLAKPGRGTGNGRGRAAQCRGQSRAWTLEVV